MDKIPGVSKKKRKWLFELIRLVGLDGARAIMTAHGGSIMYIPKMAFFLQARRDSLVYRQYCTGRYTLTLLSAKWSLGPSTVHKIIKRMALLDGVTEVETLGIGILKNTMKDEGEKLEIWKNLLGS